MSTEPYISINLIAIGNTEVGKTAYLIRNIENKFKLTLSTVGVDMRNRILELKNGKKWK